MPMMAMPFGELLGGLSIALDLCRLAQLEEEGVGSAVLDLLHRGRTADYATT
jgi:hypothetical protein